MACPDSASHAGVDSLRLIMLRRHMWLYVEFQVLFIYAFDQYQAIINRTFLLTDYAAYTTIKMTGSKRRDFRPEV
jgi:hypothetical protein